MMSDYEEEMHQEYEDYDVERGSDEYDDEMEEHIDQSRTLSKKSNSQREDEVALNKQCSTKWGSQKIKNSQGQTFILQSEIYDQLMIKVKGEVMELVCLSLDDSILIFHEFAWSMNKLQNKYFSDQNSIFRRLGFCDEQFYNNGSHTTQQNVKGFECPLCCSESEENSECAGGHRFCNDCWKNFITQKVEDKCIFFKCMQDKCTSYIRHSFIMRILQKDSLLRETYKKFLGMSYVEENKNIRYCPATDCLYAGEKADGAVVNTMKCICGTTFCFRCNQISHYPVSCKQYKEFNDMLLKDDANLLWIIKNAKLCPYCGRAVERSMGCNYIRCSNPCNKSFCYVCEKPWENDADGSHHRSIHMNCNTFTVEKNKEKNPDKSNEGDIFIIICNPMVEVISYKKMSDSQKQQNMLEKISFYVGKFKECQRSMEVILKKKQELVEETRLILHQKLNVSLIESQFLSHAFDIMLDSRLILKWSYAFAFFFQSEQIKTKALFEDLQIQFAGYCEQLAILLSDDFIQYTLEIKSTDFSKIFSPDLLVKFNNLKTRISKLSNAIKTTSTSLLESVENGSVFLD